MHGRFSGQMPPNDGLLGTLEQLGAVAAYGGGLIVQHMTAQTLSETKPAQALIDAAAKRGLPVISEIYAYTFGATIVAADYLRPDNYQKNMGRDYGDIVNTATVTPLTEATYHKLVKTAPGTNVTFENVKIHNISSARFIHLRNNAMFIVHSQNVKVVNSEFRDIHSDISQMAEAVRVSVSNIQASLGGAVVQISVDGRPIEAPAVASVDFVDVDTAALEGLVGPVGAKFAALQGCLDDHLNRLSSTDWEGNAKQQAVSTVSSFTSQARNRCTEAQNSITEFITQQLDAVTTADV